jgi:formylmethanofuran dehydrogenase subunit A
MNNKLSISIAAILLLMISSCKKYEEGPVLSLRSKTERVANNWKVEKYLLNGNDKTATLGTFTESYTKDGTYSYKWNNLSGAGKWAFEENETQIKRNGVSGMPSHDLVILKLKEKEFWYYYIDGSDKHEFHLIQE